MSVFISVILLVLSSNNLCFFHLFFSLLFSFFSPFDISCIFNNTNVYYQPLAKFFFEWRVLEKLPEIFGIIRGIGRIRKTWFSLVMRLNNTFFFSILFFSLSSISNSLTKINYFLGENSLRKWENIAIDECDGVFWNEKNYHF